jgi:hypothetical protein
VDCLQAWRRNYSEAAADFGNSGNGYSGSQHEKELILIRRDF